MLIESRISTSLVISIGHGNCIIVSSVYTMVSTQMMKYYSPWFEPWLMNHLVEKSQPDSAPDFSAVKMSCLSASLLAYLVVSTSSLGNRIFKARIFVFTKAMKQKSLFLWEFIMGVVRFRCKVRGGDYYLSDCTLICAEGTAVFLGTPPLNLNA